MATLQELYAWHQKLADLYLAPANMDIAKKYKMEAARHANIYKTQKAAWAANPKNHEAKNKAIAADLAARQALHLSAVAAAASLASSYVTHRLVAVQIKAQMDKTSVDDAVRMEMKRLLSHENLAVASAALAHPNSNLVLHAMKAA